MSNIRILNLWLWKWEDDHLTDGRTPGRSTYRPTHFLHARYRTANARNASGCKNIHTNVLTNLLVIIHFAWVVDDAKCIVVTRVCQSVCLCLSAAACSHYCTDPNVTWGSGRGCPLVVHCLADLQSVYGLRCYGNIMRTLVTSLRPSRDMTT